ncbi:MAG: class I SAM-dependent methyltransferase, partial [Hyphomicrobiaceae bacterium]
RLVMMFRDLPELVERRGTRKSDTVLDIVANNDLPEYYTQDFHFQSGGHLSDSSARLYDVQVNTLFYGSADVMRRTALHPITEFLKGRDQRGVSLLDVACGTGRFFVDVRRAYPAIKLAGLDLSPSYLAEAAQNIKGFRAVNWLEAPAEEIPLASASQDIVTCIYLFHELPPDVRRAVAGEIARVLKPGGLFVLVDSLQTGDKPDWDGLLELFPVRFHEPYYRHYLRDDLSAIFEEAGFDAGRVELAFLSKMMAFRRGGAPG